jgi:hypothetical protein
MVAGRSFDVAMSWDKEWRWVERLMIRMLRASEVPQMMIEMSCHWMRSYSDSVTWSQPVIYSINFA